MSTPTFPWRIESSLLVKKQRGSRLQVGLLFPPPGHRGRTRLSVIDGKNRREFSATWLEDGSHAECDVPGGEQLTSLLGDCLATGPESDRQQPPLWPLPFLVEQGQKRAPLTFDLLLETTFDGETPGAQSTGTLTLPWVVPTSRLYIVPLCDQDTSRETLRSAVQEARRHRAVRFAIGEGAHFEDAGPSRQTLERLVGRGQLEFMQTGPGVGAFPPRVRVAQARLDPVALPADTRGLIVLPSGFAALDIRVIPAEEGSRIICQPPTSLPRGLLHPNCESIATVCLHRVLKEGLTRTRPGRVPRGLPPYHGFAVSRWTRPEDWKGLGKALRRWNRTYSSPEIILATPSDLLSALEDLHKMGRLHLGQ